MTDARHLGLVTGGTDSERSDTYGLEMAPRRAALRDVHYIPTTTAEPECGDRTGSVTLTVANVGCLDCLGNIQRAEVDALRAEFNSRPWDAVRRMSIRKRLAQLSHTVHPDRHETPAEYEIDRLRVRAGETTLPAERERIQDKLAALGTVIHPEGSPEYAQWRETFRTESAKPGAWDFLDV